MSYAASPYGSTPYGGAGGAGDIAVPISLQSLTLTLRVPVWVAKHSVPATFALSLTIHPPTIVKIGKVAPSTLVLSLTQQTPIHKIIKLPSTLTLALTQWGPVHNSLVSIASQSLTLSLFPETPEAAEEAGATTLTLTLHAPKGKVVFKPTSYFAPFRLTVSAGFSPTIGSLAPRIVRYIKDPQVKGGCAQCGTYLYAEKGRFLDCESISSGRNFDLETGEGDYIRCGRCGFINNTGVNLPAKEGSHVGWGMKYVETEAGS